MPAAIPAAMARSTSVLEGTVGLGSVALEAGLLLATGEISSADMTITAAWMSGVVESTAVLYAGPVEVSL